LADANKELPLADSSERIALKKLTAETESWTLDEAPATLRAKTTLLLASWDTMGWILYREGKFDEAASYLEAAKLGLPGEEVKEHLTKLRAAVAASGKGNVIADPDAHKTDQQLRTIPLGPSGGRHGFAEYRLLLSHGHVERSESTDDGKLEGADGLLKAVSLARFFPADSDAKLVRQGLVNCVGGKCELVLEP
jgi:hypothetical protein